MDPRASLRKVRGQETTESVNTCHACVIIGVGVLSLILILCLVLAGLGLGIAELVMGGIYFHDCPLQPYLPIFLIVDACTAGVLATKCGKKDDGGVGVGTIIRIIVGFFSLAWWVAGTVWVVNVREVIYAPGHCQPSNTTMIPLTTPLTTLPPNMTTQANETKAPLLLLSTLGISQSTDGINSGAIVFNNVSSQEECLTCNEALTDFTLAVVVIHWSLAALGVFLLLLLGLNYCFVKMRG